MMFKMSNNFYDVAKYLILVVEPALVTLIIGLGKLYGWETELIVGTISLVTTFFGSILMISSNNYAKQTKEK